MRIELDRDFYQCHVCLNYFNDEADMDSRDIEICVECGKTYHKKPPPEIIQGEQ